MNGPGILSQEDRWQYQGKLVALDNWLSEGHLACVVAAGENIETLEMNLFKIGKTFQDVIVFYVPPEKVCCYAREK